MAQQPSKLEQLFETVFLRELAGQPPDPRATEELRRALGWQPPKSRDSQGEQYREIE